MKTQTDIEPFASLLGQDQKRGVIESGYTWEIHAQNFIVTVKMGQKYARVDVGTSGKYMVDLATGEIFGIKGYGVIHRGHRYGCLDTISEWDWRGYSARSLAKTFQREAVA